MAKTNKNLIFIGTGLLVVIIAGGIIYYQKNRPQEFGFTAEKAGEKVMNYIAGALPDTQASLIGVIEENGLYKLNLNIDGQKFVSYVSKDGKLLFPQVIDLEAELPEAEAGAETEEEGQAETEGITIGNFSVSQDEICQENDKPVIYFFGSASCPHCVWEHPIAEKVAENFGDEIVFHNNMDSQNDENIFRKYSTGSIPALVLGCKYYRVGSGESWGVEQEKDYLTALICKLTGNQPSHICDPVQELIGQIGE